MSKVKKITISNLKAVGAATIDLDGSTAIITGRNNSGKSTILKALPERLQGIKPSIILKHEESEGFAEWTLTTGEKFVWTFNDKGKEKLTYISERNIPGSVTKDVCKRYFPATFDVDEFLNSTPAKQKSVLQKLTGIDFTEIDKLWKDAYDQRTFFNKQLAIEQAKSEFVDPKLQVELIPFDELEKELNGIEVHNLRFENTKKNTLEKQSLIASNLAEIQVLEEKIKDLKMKNNGIELAIREANNWMNDETNRPKTNAEKLQKDIADIKALNQEITENNKAREQEKIIEKAKDNAGLADAEVKRLESEKLDVIKNASMPEGFGFSDEGITYNGYEFRKEQLSSSGIYIAALKLAALGLGEVKTLHFDASFLDKNSLAEIEKWANEQDLQCLIERPDFQGGEIEYQIINNAQ